MARLPHWLGLDAPPVSHTEKLVSGLGAFCGIFAVYWISRQFLGVEASLYMVASMGAGAVLLFAVPHGQLSQPWPALAGHLVSAAIGVTCAKFIPHAVVAAAAAVSLAIVAMHYTKSIHPPGGATALVAVTGGPDVTALGYSYVAAPVLLNAITIVLIAILFNGLFAWRRYPAAWAKAKPAPAGPVISTADLEAAMREMDLLVDVSEDDLLKLYERAKAKSGKRER